MRSTNKEFTINDEMKQTKKKKISNGTLIKKPFAILRSTKTQFTFMCLLNLTKKKESESVMQTA